MLPGLNFLIRSIAIVLLTLPSLSLSQTITSAVVRSGYASANGLNLYYEIHGSGQPLVLSHEIGFWNVQGSYAYAVIAGALSVTIKGQTVVRTGTFAYTFSKHGLEWKIDAQAWGRTS